MVPRVDNVPFGLGHFLSFSIEDEPEAQTTLVGRFVKHSGRHGEQCVEPTTGLVDPFANVVDREGLIEGLTAIKRVVPLSKRSASRVKPTIHDECFSNHCGAVVIDERECIHNRSMEIHIIGAWWVFESSSGGLCHFHLKFLNRTDAFHLAALASPNWERCTPIAFSRNRPILDVAQPFTESPFANPIRSPFDAIVEFEQAFFDRRHAHKPGVHGIVEERMTCSPAMWIVVQVGFFTVEQAAFRSFAIASTRNREQFNDGLIAIFDVPPIKFSMGSFDEGPIHSNGVVCWQSGGHSEVVVIFTVHHGSVDNASTVGGCHPVRF